MNTSSDQRAEKSETLTDLKVYRCGAANLTVYVVGRDTHGRLAGFKTRAVET
jgi:hypothetical protein